MMSEKNLRQYINKGLADLGGHICSHEDLVTVGVPDMSYVLSGCSGWIEYKWLKDWPARSRTVVKMSRYTAQQKAFLRERGEAGGRCFLLLQVGNEWLLFGHWGAQLVGDLTRRELIRMAIGVWVKRVDFPGLRERLRLPSDDSYHIRAANLLRRSSISD